MVFLQYLAMVYSFKKGKKGKLEVDCIALIICNVVALAVAISSSKYLNKLRGTSSLVKDWHEKTMNWYCKYSLPSS